MITIKGDIWNVRRPPDWVVITINDTVRKDGGLVMGRGIALEAAAKYQGIQHDWGKRTTLRWNDGIKEPEVFVDWERRLIAFPVKYHWAHPADINLVLRSTIQLVSIEPTLKDGNIMLGWPGCGNGKLDRAEVEPMLRHYLTSNRFIVFNK